MKKGLIVILCFWVVSCASQKHMINKGITSCDSWSLVEGVHEGKPLIIRYRDCGAEYYDEYNYPKLFRVTWVFDHNGSYMPSAEITDEMTAFENRLVSALEGTKNGVLVAVVTTGGYREWVYYSKDKRTFSEVLANISHEDSPYPVMIESSDDSGWSYLKRDILMSIKKS